MKCMATVIALLHSTCSCRYQLTSSAALQSKRCRRRRLNMRSGATDSSPCWAYYVTRDPSCGFVISATTPKGRIQAGAVACSTVVGYDLGGVRPDLHQTDEANAAWNSRPPPWRCPKSISIESVRKCPSLQHVINIGATHTSRYIPPAAPIPLCLWMSFTMLWESDTTLAWDAGRTCQLGSHCSRTKPDLCLKNLVAPITLWNNHLQGSQQGTKNCCNEIK